MAVRSACPDERIAVNGRGAYSVSVAVKTHSMLDSVLRALRIRSAPKPVEPWENAPWDDEPLTTDDLAAIEEAEQDFAAGRVYTQAEVESELGI